MQNPAAVSSICHLAASAIAQLIREKEISPVEVVREHLRRIQALNPLLNAFTDLDADRALVDAKRAECAVMKGRVRNASLLGVPISIKSCIDVQGLRCAAGTRLRADYVATKDATLVARLKQAGAIVIGNTSTPELLMAYHTENALQDRTNNPWDLRRTPGGSSGGEAAAIASGMSAAGFGSDGGGSIRVPAHFSGICGLKPTPGVIPATGHFPECLGPFSLLGVVGPMARTVEDLQLLFAVASGYDPDDIASVPASGDEVQSSQIRTLRIGFYEDDGETIPTPETSAAVRAAAAALRNAGFTVEPFRPEILSRARELWFAIFVQAGAMLLESLLHGREDEISPGMRDFLALAAERPHLTGERLLSTLTEIDHLRLRVRIQMQDYPILLAPVCSMPAFLHEEGGWGPSHPADYVRTMAYCQHYNLLGNPAAVVPVGRSRDGLPIGVQVIGRPYRDSETLAVSSILNQQFPWQAPPLCVEAR